MSTTQASVEGQTGSLAESVLRYFRGEGKRLCLNARFENAESNLICTIDNTWELHEVVVGPKEFSFTASKSGQKMKFSLQFTSLVELAKEWFAEIAAKLKAGTSNLVEAIIPGNIIFQAGVTV